MHKKKDKKKSAGTSLQTFLVTIETDYLLTTFLTAMPLSVMTRAK